MVSAVVIDIAIGGKGRGFSSRVGQIGHCVGNGSAPLRGFFVAVLFRCQAADMDDATCFVRRCSTASTMNLFVKLQSCRSPWSNTYDPPIDDGAKPSSKLRDLEISANTAFDSYREM